MSRRMAILTEGVSDPMRAKTAASVLRYVPEEVVGLIDTTRVGSTAAELFGVGGDRPVVGSLVDLPEADALLIGIAPPGGRLPASMRPVVEEAVERGMQVISGLHEFLGEDPDLVERARRTGANLWDVRKNREREVARRDGLDERCLRIQTVGHDCSVGKMVTALEVTRGLQRAGEDAKFVATGQTGIVIEGDGCPIDCVVADFINGAAERLVLHNQHHRILLIEGQGSLVHPRYSAVTMGLLHGCIPHGLIFCYQIGRDRFHGMEHVPIPPLERILALYEDAARLAHPCRVIGVALNSHGVDEARLRAEKAWVRQRFGLPACDTLREGAAPLVEAVRALQRERTAGGVTQA